MANHDDRRKESDQLDRMLDAALTKYALVEPREGLEERILANLHAADKQSAPRTWWHWGFTAALAAVLLIAAAVMWRWNKPAHPPLAIDPPTLKQAPVAPEFAIGDRNTEPPTRSLRRSKSRRAPERQAVAAGPKLDVFPSPLPLSEQEKILAAYVAQYPGHAALVAEARMDDLRHEVEERRQIVADEPDNRR